MLFLNFEACTFQRIEDKEDLTILLHLEAEKTHHIGDTLCGLPSDKYLLAIICQDYLVQLRQEAL